MLKIVQICTRCKKPFGSTVSDGAAIDFLKKNNSKKKATLVHFFSNLRVYKNKNVVATDF